MIDRCIVCGGYVCEGALVCHECILRNKNGKSIKAASVTTETEKDKQGEKENDGKTE